MAQPFVVHQISRLLTLEGAVRKHGRGIESSDLGIIEDAAMVIVPNRRGAAQIAWVGRRNELPRDFKKLKKVSLEGRLVLPGLIDSHTHLVFAGDRSGEFEMRLAGKTYQEIAAAGGGISSTVKATRESSRAKLYAAAAKRLNAFIRQGVTTIEIKTGYGLDFASEKKSLQVVKRLKKEFQAHIVATFLGAHAVPPEFKGRRQEYVRMIAQDWLPKLRKQCDFVDMFLDDGYFDTVDAEVLLSAAQKLGLAIKLHADELELTGGTETAIRFGALSADHLLQIGDAEIKALSQSEVTATLLPTTALFLKAPYAPARKLLDRGARVALATDFNPGTSPTLDISLVGLTAALKMNMRSEEIITALTLNGAYALGLQQRKGALLQGYDADFIAFDCQSPAALFYNFGQGRPLPLVYINGRQATLRD